MLFSRTFLAAFSFVSAVIAGPPSLDTPTALVERQVVTTCASQLHIMIAGGCTIPCTEDVAGLLATLVHKVLAAYPQSDYWIVPYDNSTYQGAVSSVLMAQAANQYVLECPNTPIVFLGYSLGGIIVMNTLCGSMKTENVPNVVAAITYGEETRRWPASYDLGTCQASAPLFPRNNTQLCEPFAPAIQGYCDSADPKCCTGGTNSADHFVYAQNYDNAAMEFISARYAAYLASPTSTSSSSSSTLAPTSSTTSAPIITSSSTIITTTTLTTITSSSTLTSSITLTSTLSSTIIIPPFQNSSVSVPYPTTSSTETPATTSLLSSSSIALSDSSTASGAESTTAFDAESTSTISLTLTSTEQVTATYTQTLGSITYTGPVSIPTGTDFMTSLIPISAVVLPSSIPSFAQLTTPATPFPTATNTIPAKPLSSDAGSPNGAGSGTKTGHGSATTSSGMTIFTPGSNSAGRSGVSGLAICAVIGALCLF